MVEVPPVRSVVGDPLARFPETIRQFFRDREFIRNYDTGAFIVGPGNRGDHVCQGEQVSCYRRAMRRWSSTT